MYYPLFIDLRHQHCLIVGAGAVGLRKAEGLVAAHAGSITILDKNNMDTTLWGHICIKAKEIGTKIIFEQRSFTPKDLSTVKLVFACTSQKDVNTNIAKLCLEKGIFCNCVDAPLEGNCIVPALAKVQGAQHPHADFSLMAALSTGGASPAWSRLLRSELEAWLKPHAPMTALLGRLRPLVLALNEDTRHNTELFRKLIHSSLRENLVRQDKNACTIDLEKILPLSLHKHIMDLLHDII